MPYQFTQRRRVAFSETDMAGIVHFSQFFRWMEDAEHAFWRSLGVSVVWPDSGGYLGWPRVQAGCEYLSPLKFEEEFDVQLLVRKIGRKSLSCAYRFTRADNGKPVATGSMTAVCVRHLPDGGLQSIPILDSLRSQLQEAPADLLADVTPEKNR